MTDQAKLVQAQQLFAGGDLKQAGKLCRKLLQKEPSSGPLLHLSALIELREGRLEKALGAAKQALAAADASPRYFGTLGRIYQTMGKDRAAGQAFLELTRRVPASAEGHVALGNLHVSSGRLEEAESAFRAAIAVEPRAAEAHYGLGLVLGKQGDLDAALSCYETCMRLAPNLVQAQVNAANIHLRRSRAEQAAALYRSVLQRYPNWAMVLGNYAMALRLLDQPEQAIAAYRRALALQPGDLETLSNLAVLLEETGNLDEAERLARQGLAAAPGQPRLQLVMGRIERRRGQSDRAKTRLAAIDPSTLPDALAGDLCHELGFALDLLNEPDAALQAFARANAYLREEARRLGVDGARYREWLARLQSYAADLEPRPAAASEAATDDESDPVFLVGFPRSGTTLLDRILGSHPRIEVLEEKPFLARVKSLAEQKAGPMPENADALQAQDIDELRGEYRRLAQGARGPSEGRILVDKLPLNSTEVPFILKLFPAAKFIFALRHPYDVCLSCYMQPFAPNTAVTNFFTLEETAELYAAVMDLWRCYEEKLHPHTINVRYEDLVEDFRRETQRVLEFLGLEPHAELEKFHEIAGNAGLINTPSYHQVVRPIHRESLLRWKRYEGNLSALKDRLQPYATRCGYEDD